MIIQISSGQGPAECELAVGKFAQSIMKEFPGTRIIESHPGRLRDCFCSLMLESEADLSILEGSILWICRSPFRPEYKRKNWFIDVHVVPDAQKICTDGTVRFERCHAGGCGGQNVNKVESGVRLRYLYQDPDTGKEEEILIENTETRDQPKNRAKALLLLRSRLYDLAMKKRQEERDKLEGQKKRIEWGSQIRSYVLHPYKMVNDLRTGYKTADTQGVLDGDLNEFMRRFLMQEGSGGPSAPIEDID